MRKPSIEKKPEAKVIPLRELPSVESQKQHPEEAIIRSGWQALYELDNLLEDHFKETRII